MSSSKFTKSDLESFNEDLSRTLSQLFKRHGLDFAGVKGRSSDGFYFFNVCATDGDADKAYGELYLQNCEAMGLPDEWLGSHISNPDSGRMLRVIGLDPSFAEKCVRLEDQVGNRFNITPAELLELMSKK